MGRCTCRPPPASSPTPTRAPNGSRPSTRRARSFAPRSSRTLRSPKLVHARKGVRKLLLKPVPVRQRVVAEPRAVARERLAVRQLEAQETKVQAGQHRLDLRQREAMLLHVEQEIAAAAHTVEVLVAREILEFGARTQR